MKNACWPDGALLAGQEAREDLGIVELVAEREVVGAEVAEPVVLPELGRVRGRHGLDADERPDLLLDRLHVGRDLLEAALVLVAGVQVHERDAGLGLRAGRDLDDVARRPSARPR